MRKLQRDRIVMEGKKIKLNTSSGSSGEINELEINATLR